MVWYKHILYHLLDVAWVPSEDTIEPYWDATAERMQAWWSERFKGSDVPFLIVTGFAAWEGIAFFFHAFHRYYPYSTDLEAHLSSFNEENPFLRHRRRVGEAL